MDCDVAVIGGGPGGSTVATLLRKYCPRVRVKVFEKLAFPRDHIGESQLPGVSAVLNEMGVWEKVEAANFPIKLGGTFLWGRSSELWNIDFYPVGDFKDEPRPAKYEGQRRSTAFQVDRSIYDKILLDHAAESGVEVHQPLGVSRVERSGHRVTGLHLENGELVTARYYVDASGNAAVLRKAMEVPIEVPTLLKNVAFWDYWQNAEWAVKIGVGGTRIQVISVDHGWIWFIPLGPTRTSVGFVTSAQLYRDSRKSPRELYELALASSPRISKLLANASPEGKFEGTKDWSFVAERSYGENWFLVGETAGFADPILSAGLMITQHSARELAYTINELERGELEPEWLKQEFSSRQLARVRNHIRFADYWYSANAQVKDLKGHAAEIAKGQGLNLDPEEAWQWIAQGGFIDEDLNPGTGSFSIGFLKSMGEFLSELKFESPLLTCNVFELNLEGAEEGVRGWYENGRVARTKCLVRDRRFFPFNGVFGLLHNILQKQRTMPEILKSLAIAVEPLARKNPQLRSVVVMNAIRGLEALCYDGWVNPSRDPAVPMSDFRVEYKNLHWNEDDVMP